MCLLGPGLGCECGKWAGWGFVELEATRGSISSVLLMGTTQEDWSSVARMLDFFLPKKN